jgi:hypothetical protein
MRLRAAASAAAEAGMPEKKKAMVWSTGFLCRAVPRTMRRRDRQRLDSAQTRSPGAINNGNRRYTMPAKKFLFHEEARERIRRGVDPPGGGRRRSSE